MYQRFKFVAAAILAGVTATAAIATSSSRADETIDSFTDREIAFFENQVRPLLVEHCYECHSEQSERLEAGLRLDRRDLAIAGGDSGPAVVPANPSESLLIEAIRWKSFEMPPKRKLKDADIAVLVKWIEIGAPWPAEKPRQNNPTTAIIDWDLARSRHWAWQPVRRAKIPDVRAKEWPLSEIDHFVLAKLESVGLDPAPPAEPRILVRRLYFDLIGLPPTPEQVSEFVQAAKIDRPAATADLVDRLLESPHYGERWGRYWLDVARYSDGFGGFLDNAALPNAWRYRDWVVAALNRDLAYDAFVRQQIAGDLMDEQHAAIATGFFALGPTYRSDGGDPDSVAQSKSATLDDRVDTLSRGLLGLTAACARCHDHKFDPIPQLDYYSLAGVFQNTRVVEHPLASKQQVDDFNKHQKAVTELDKKIKAREAEIKKQKREPNAGEKLELEKWRAELAELRKTGPAKYDVAHALTDAGNADMKLAIRGNLRRPGKVAPRRFLRVLAGADPPRFSRGSGRLDLADAVVSEENPLTARVFVNRVWRHHFGKALVGSTDNFGLMGQTPSHPELLDWLAAEFVENGWSIKQLHRTIVLTASYSMSTRYDERSFAIDGDNRLLWRMNPRRLDVEAWRDALLAVTGELDTTLGGPPTDQILSSNRRTLYAKVSRNGDTFASDEFLRLFDFPIPRASVPGRPTSIVPQQFLFMMNSPFMAERAKAFSDRLRQKFDNDRDRIGYAYELLYGRAPTEEEGQIGLEFVSAAEKRALSQWNHYAQVLLSANEFMYIQ